jgi:DNA polymerase III alpha subunit
MVASNALVRPGAYETVAKDYIKRKHGKEETTYPHPDMEPWLKETFGLAVYQEQVMMASIVLGGFTPGESNKLRKIIGKKRDAKEFQPFYEKWMKGAGAKIGEPLADKLWHEFEKHAGYSFNKSHADSYSYISYVTAYLKHHYPLEYIYAMIKWEKSAMTKMTYLLEAKRLGIEILPPDVNYSGKDMEVQGESLRFGLTDIKQVGIASANHIISKRPFNSWEEWADKIVPKQCNAQVVASLVAVDALNSIPDAPHNSEAEKNYMEYLNYPIDLEHVVELGINYQPIDEYEEGGPYIVVCGVVKDVKRTAKYVKLELEDISGKLTCFGSMTNDLSKGEVVIALIGDKSMMGYARVAGFKERRELGTLDGFEKLLLGEAFSDLEQLYSWGMGKIGDAKSLLMPLNVRRITTKKGQQMAFAMCTDGDKVIKLTIFPKTWDVIEHLIHEYEPICVRLRSLDDGGWTVNHDGVINAKKLLQDRLEKTNA